MKQQLTEPKRMPFIQRKDFQMFPKGVCVCVCMCVCVYIYIFFFFPPQSNSKLKLVRSLAVCEESSAPFVDGPLETQVGPL